MLWKIKDLFFICNEYPIWRGLSWCSLELESVKKRCDNRKILTKYHEGLGQFKPYGSWLNGHTEIIDGEKKDIPWSYGKVGIVIKTQRPYSILWNSINYFDYKLTRFYKGFWASGAFLPKLRMYFINSRLSKEYALDCAKRGVKPIPLSWE